MPTEIAMPAPRHPVARTEDTGSGLGACAAQGAGWVWSGTQDAARWTADRVEESATWTWDALRARPSLGGLVLGCAGLGASMMIGVGELAVGMAIGYAGYLMLAKGETPMQALREVIALEDGEVEKPAKGGKR
jgi:hypothetical protein